MDHFSTNFVTLVNVGRAPMTFALARSLLLADAVTQDALAQALLVAATRGTSLVRALLATRAIDAMRLEQQLERGDAPAMRHVAPVMALVQQLPPGLCERLLALPVRRDPRTGTIDVAVVDARDPHPVEEMAHWLRAPVRMVRTSLTAMDAALRRIHAKPQDAGPRPLAAPIWVPPAQESPREVTKTPAYGSPIVDESQMGTDLDDESRTEIVDFGMADPNIPFSLTKKSVGPVLIARMPAEEADTGLAEEPVLDLRRRAGDVEPILDLRRRKSVPPQLPSLPFEPVGPILDAMRAAGDRDAILEQVVFAAHTVARKVAVLAVRKDMLVGWTCSPEFGDRTVLRAARIPPAMSDVLQGVLESEVALLSRIPKDGTHAPLVGAMKVPPAGEVAMVAVRVEGKPVALVVADDVGDSLHATKRLEEIAQVAGDALGRLLRERRR
jgi:hypothetical protein